MKNTEASKNLLFDFFLSFSKFEFADAAVLPILSSLYHGHGI